MSKNRNSEKLTSRSTVEERLRLDISDISNHLNEVGNTFEYRLRYGQGEKSENTVNFTYKSREELVAHYDWFDKTIYLEWTECHFGGERPWFVCQKCGERKGVLFDDVRFHCRKCLDLTYQSSNISDPEKKAMHKLRKIGQKLMPDKELDYRTPIKFDQIVPTTPEKPDHMHQDTYNDLLNEWLVWRLKLKKSIKQDFAKIAEVELNQ